MVQALVSGACSDTSALQNLTMRHAAAVALHFMHYKFARVHQSLRVTPAMQAGSSDHVWTLAEVVALLALSV